MQAALAARPLSEMRAQLHPATTHLLGQRAQLHTRRELTLHDLQMPAESGSAGRLSSAGCQHYEDQSESSKSTPKSSSGRESGREERATGVEEEEDVADDHEERGGGIMKRAWAPDEDARLLELVEEFGPRRWSVIACHLQGRVGKQCRERWHNHLCPSVNKEDWTEEEDQLIMELVQQWGTKWSKIVKMLPGRTDNAIKNRWNSTMRKNLRRQLKESGSGLDENVGRLLAEYNAENPIVRKRGSPTTAEVATAAAAVAVTTAAAASGAKGANPSPKESRSPSKRKRNPKGAVDIENTGGMSPKKNNLGSPGMKQDRLPFVTDPCDDGDAPILPRPPVLSGVVWAPRALDNQRSKRELPAPIPVHSAGTRASPPPPIKVDGFAFTAIPAPVIIDSFGLEENLTWTRDELQLSSLGAQLSGSPFAVPLSSKIDNRSVEEAMASDWMGWYASQSQEDCLVSSPLLPLFTPDGLQTQFADLFSESTE